MAVNPNRQPKSIAYTSDDTQQYALVTSHNHAVTVGGTSGLGLPGYPKRWKPRLVHGVQINATGRDIHASLAVPNRADALWQRATTTFNLAPHGLFQITGRTGERRTQGAADFDGVATPGNGMVLINYVDDENVNWFLTTSRGHAAAVSAVAPAVGSKPFPRGWTPRHYNCISTDLTGVDQKCILVEPNRLSPAWESDVAYAFTVTGLGTFASTGRTDEKTHRGAPAGP